MVTEEKILEKFIQSHTVVALRVLENLTDKDLALLIEELPTMSSAKLLGQMDRYRGARILEKMECAKAAKLIEQIPMPAVLILLRLVSEGSLTSILENIPVEAANSIRKTLTYPRNCAGAFLDTRPFSLYQDFTVNEALERLKSPPQPVFSPVYVLDRDQTLVGKVELKDLITSDPGKTIKAIMMVNPLKILGNTKISTLTRTEKSLQSFDNLPVVDSQGFFLGLLTKESLSAVDAQEKPLDHQAIQASSALGDLYQIGLSSLFRT